MQQNYQAHETLIPVPDINSIDQSIVDGFDDELLEINVRFDDPVNEENFYLMKLYICYLFRKTFISIILR